jgi:hypothetical protein
MKHLPSRKRHLLRIPVNILPLAVFSFRAVCAGPRSRKKATADPRRAKKKHGILFQRNFIIASSVDFCHNIYGE